MKEGYISQKVYDCYWIKGINCAATMLSILSEIHEINLDRQVINSAIERT